MKQLLLLAIGILTVGLVYVINQWPQNPSRTFSQHVATSKAGVYFYIALFVTVIPLLAVFFYGYFIPTHHLPVSFGIAVGIAMIMQLIAAFIPEVEGWKSAVHRWSAGVSAFALFAATVITTFSLSLSLPVWLFGVGTAVTMIVCSILVARQSFQHQYFLWLQSIYYGLFFAAIFAVAYYG